MSAPERDEPVSLRASLDAEDAAAAADPSQSSRPVPPATAAGPDDQKEDIPKTPDLSPEEKAKKVEELGARLWLLFQQHVGKLVAEDMDYAEMQAKLKQKDIVNIAARFRHVIACVERQKLPHREMKGYHFKNARVLLAASIIHKFPKETLYAGKEEEDEQSKVCFQAATSVVKYVYHPESLVDDGVPSKQDLSRAYRVVKLFDSIFGQWKRRDAENVMETLGDRHAQLSKSLAILNSLDPSKLEKLSDTIRTLERSLEETKAKITKFADADALLVIEADTNQQLEMQPTPFPSCPNTPMRGPMTSPGFKLPASPFRLPGLASQASGGSTVQDDEKTGASEEADRKMINLDKIIKDESAKLYWREFGNQLANNDHHRLYQLLTEIRKRITKLNPHKKDEMEEQMDIDFIRQTIEHKAFDLATFHQLFGGIHQHIKSLQAAADDKSWQEFYDKVLEEAAGGKPVNELLPEVFNRVLIQLDRIEDAVKKFRAIQNLREDGSGDKST